ncbi:MAG: UMP kinase [Kiritimatiellae bacterium]|nr:UMP kinase [Kiritimatiellia bacterium]
MCRSNFIFAAAILPHVAISVNGDLSRGRKFDILSSVKKGKANVKYRRILLKLSGEVLGNRETGECIDPDRLAFMAERVKKIHGMGVEIGIVLGGGNIFRGLAGAGKGVNRVTGDSMGMLATVINALAMMNALESIGVPTRVMTSIEMPKLAEPFIQRRALRHLEKGRVVIFGGGTGNPYFSTDSAAALKASEIGADALLKATKVDGIYTADPKKDPKAKKYGSLKYETALEKRLKVMDSAAFALRMDNGIPIIVFDFFDKNALGRVVKGEAVGTIVS